MQKLKILILGLILGTALSAGIAYAAPILTYEATLIPLSNNAYDLGTSSQMWRNIYVNSITTNGCTGCGGGGGSVGNWFTPNLNYNATSTAIGFLAGLFSNSSTTFNGTLHIGGFSAGGLGVDSSGLVYSGATTTFSSPLNYLNGGVTCQTASGSQAGCLSSSDWTTFNSKGNGTVTSVATDGTLTGGTITTTGTLGINLTAQNIWTGLLQQFKQASTTLFSVANGTATDTISSIATSSFATGISAPIFNATSLTASSTFANGLFITNGCVNVQGVCLGAAGSVVTGTSLAVQYATAVALPTNNYVAGVITEVGNGALSVDGSSPIVGDRILVKNESTGANNGIYTVTATGSAIAVFVLTRATDYNSSANVYPGIATYVIGGSTLNDDWWALTTPAPITIGATALTYVESGSGAITFPLATNQGGTNNASIAADSILYMNHAATKVFGVATSSLFGVCTGGQVVGWSNTIGGLGCIATSTTSGFNFPFNAGTFGAIATQATSTAINDSNGLMASSTSWIDNIISLAATTTAFSATTASTTRLFVSNIGNSVSGCLQANTAGLVSQTGSACSPNISAGDGLIFSGATLNSPFNYSAGVLTTNSDLGAAISKFGIASSTPFSQLSIGTGLASSSISVAEYKYGTGANVATSTTQNIDCNASNQIAEPIGFSATTLTLINMIPGKACKIVVQNPNGTAGTVTWAFPSGHIIHWAGGGTVPTQTTSANAMDTWSFEESVGSSTKQIIGAMTPW